MFGRKKPTPKVRGMKVRETRYRNVTKKYPKSYTIKEWKRFSPDIQQELTNRYNVTISDYKTRGQKAKGIAKSFNKKNIVKAGRKTNAGVMKFSNTMNSIDRGLREFDRAFPKQKGKSTLDRLAGY